MPIAHISLLWVLFPSYFFSLEIKKCSWWGKQPVVKDWCLTSLTREDCILKRQPFMRPFSGQLSHACQSFGSTKRTVILFWRVALQAPRETFRKNPHPGSEIIHTTVGHKVTQVNPDHPAEGSISTSFSHVWKNPFFWTSQTNGYQPSCFDTIKTWLPPIPAQPGSSLFAFSTSKAGVGALKSHQSCG